MKLKKENTQYQEKPYCVSSHLYGFNDCILHGLLIIALFQIILCAMLAM